MQCQQFALVSILNQVSTELNNVNGKRRKEKKRKKKDQRLETKNGKPIQTHLSVHTK